ncbi:MAG: hypothetical protein WC959_01300, partial [Kiritimatiellales bacterium]
QTVDFANALQSITGTIEFRVYLWPSQGHGAVNTRNLRIDALSLYGDISVIPEPAVISFYFVTLLVLLGWRKFK